MIANVQLDHVRRAIGAGQDTPAGIEVHKERAQGAVPTGVAWGDKLYGVSDGGGRLPAVRGRDLLVRVASHRPVVPAGVDEVLYHWRAELVVPEALFEIEALEEADREILRATSLAEDPDGFVLATAGLYRYDWSQESDPRQVFEATSADMERFVALFGDDGELDDELREACLAAFFDVLVLDELSVAPAWRGRLLGPLLAASAISNLGRSCALVAAFPEPYELELEAGEMAYLAELERLERLWERFGFIRWRGGIWYLPLAMTTLANTLSWLIGNV